MQCLVRQPVGVNSRSHSTDISSKFGVFSAKASFNRADVGAQPRFHGADIGTHATPKSQGQAGQTHADGHSRH